MDASKKLDKDRLRVLKNYQVMTLPSEAIRAERIEMLHTLPPGKFLLVKTLSGGEHILKISYFIRTFPGAKTDIYATRFINHIICRKHMKYLGILTISFEAIKSWRVWEPKLAPLIINWPMSEWFKSFAFNK